MNKEYNVVNALLDYEGTSPYKREVSFFLTTEEGIISSTTNNCGGSVEFDWDTIWFDHLKNKKSDHVYMIHSHPPGFNRMSGIDENMVYGWCLALGANIEFSVVTDTDMTVYFYSQYKNDVGKKIVDRNVIAAGKHDQMVKEYTILSKIIYGISKADQEINKEDLNRIIKTINESNLMEAFK
jgi:proteasome lid subunit RPN8/RPN11